MNDERPNPDSLLRSLSLKEKRENRGKLKIFFGYAAGVGKTYAMLEAAHVAKQAGIDVVVGYVEPHVRPETLALLNGLEVLSTLEVTHKNIILHEFDLDKAVKRHPELILVDEMAHTNADICRHRKRYQDIEELLKAGINVYTTINVQHLESLNDIIASITGIVVNERIPDSAFDNADQIELVDIEPDDLVLRLNKGKIYKEQQAKNALDNFFTRDNLVALREIALRQTADHVNKMAEKSKDPEQKHGYFTEEHILICLSASPFNAKVIRTAARMADAFHGSFTALFVETPRTSELNSKNRERLRQNLKLAEQLGATIATVYGEDVAYQISEYAKASGVSKIVIGHSNNKRGLFSAKNFVDRLTELAPNIDIHIIPDTTTPHEDYHNNIWSPMKGFSAVHLLKTLGILSITTILCLGLDYFGFNEVNIIVVYILGILITAMMTTGKLYAVISSVLGVSIFNYFFTAPRYSLQVNDVHYWFTFIIMFIASLLTSRLTTRVRRHARESSQKAYRTAVLLETSQKLQRAKDKKDIFENTAQQIIKLLDKTVIIYPVMKNKLDEPKIYSKVKNGTDFNMYTASDERAVAEWVYKNNKHAGATTNTLPGAKCLYLAIRNHDTVFAVLAIPINEKENLETYEKYLLIAMLGECALALEKDQINETKNQVEIEIQQEKLRFNILRAISHDLRTPLTSISGNAGILMENSKILNETKKNQLYTDIYDDSMWLINLVENLLSVTRIENDGVSLHLEPELISEIIEEALLHINRKSVEHEISVHIDDDMLMANMNSRLIVQVIINIVDNAIKYTPIGSHISISARKENKMIYVEIADDGEGISAKSKEKLFGMFYTVDNLQVDGRRGLGLGLFLCKSIILAHQGSIDVKDNIPHGTIFCFTLPAEEVPYYEQT